MYNIIKLLVILIFSIYTAGIKAGVLLNELRTSSAVLNVDKKGMIRITDKDGGVMLNSSLHEFFIITVINTSRGTEHILLPGKETHVTQSTEDEIRIERDNYIIDAENLSMNTAIHISVLNDAFVFEGKLHNSTNQWKIKELVFPCFSGAGLNDGKTKIYWPFQLGQCFTNPEDFGERSFDYPSLGGTMAWFTLNNGNSGIYFACHDSERAGKRFKLGYDSNRKSFSTKILFPVNSNEFTIPPVIIKPYSGTWHLASKTYRSWYDANFKIAEVSDWARRCEGYMLTILKQQNGDVMYTYPEIDKLGTIADKLNFSIVGLWGRGVGGHDRYYPNYMPDNLLGGRTEIVKAIERLHDKGFKVMVYTNGKIIDTSTDYYLYNGIETIILNDKKQPVLEFWKKHKNSAPVIFSTACPGSSKWRQTMFDLALDAQSMGVDVFYIDQLGQQSPLIGTCYNSFHDHELPQEAFASYRIKLYQEIRTELKKRNPDVCIMTEGINDAILGEVDLFQGIPTHLSIPFLYPEIFRYTFPEVICITQNSDPALIRYDANFSTLYGLRHEIMSRYPADARYLQEGIIPSETDYSNITGPPDVVKFGGYPAEELARYTHDLFQFENDNAEFLRYGKFIDDIGLSIKGSDIVAKGFQSDNRIGVVVWNKNLNDKRNYEITLPGYSFISACAPGKGKIDKSDYIESNNLQLLIFERSNP